MKRVRRFAPWRAALGCAAAWIGIIYLLVLMNRPPAGAAAEQERIVAAIQTFRERRGRLPDNLQEAGIEFDQNLFDSVWYHKAFDNPNEFEIGCCKHFWDPTPCTHEWYYRSKHGTWEYYKGYD